MSLTALLTISQATNCSRLKEILMEMFIQSVRTGKIYNVLKTAGEKQLKSGQFVRVDDARAERIKASTVRYGR